MSHARNKERRAAIAEAEAEKVKIYSNDDLLGGACLTTGLSYSVTGSMTPPTMMTAETRARTRMASNA